MHIGTASGKERIQTELADKSIEDNIDVLLKEGEALGLTRVEIFKLIQAEINLNKQELEMI